MVDVPRAQVRVLPDRLKKKLKKTISELDRVIQIVDADYKRSNIDWLGISLDECLNKHWRDRANKLFQRRQMLDEKRKQARLRLKGLI